MNRLSRSHARVGAALILGGALEAAVAFAFASSDRYAAVAAGLGILVAVLAGAVGGWWVGLTVAAAGWLLHLLLVAGDSLRALAGLPAWLGAGIVAGWLSTRLTAEMSRRKGFADELAALRDVASEAIVGVDRDGTIVGWGAGAEAMYGYSAGDAIGVPLSLLAGEEEGGAEDLTEAVRVGHRVEGLRAVHRRKDGDELTVSVSIAPVTADGGEPTGAVVVAADVGESARLTEGLREMEAKYQSLTAQLPDVTYIYPVSDRDVAVYVSDQVEQLLGYSSDQWLAERGLFGQLVHADDRDRVLSELAEARASGEPFRAEYRLLARDGRVVWVRDGGAIVRDARGNALYVQGYLRDVSDRLRSEEETERTRAAEQAALAEVQEKQRKLDFLAKATGVIASSSDYETTLRRVAELAVREFADWCLVDVLDEDGSLIRLVAADAGARVAGGPVPGADPEPETLEVVRRLRPVLSDSRISVPLVARGRALGAVTFLSAAPRRSYGADDLALLQGLATTAALAVDDARLQGQVEERADAARVLTYVADAVFLLDRGGVIRLWNPAAEAITGLDAGTVIGQPAAHRIAGWESLAERIPVGNTSDPPSAATLPLETERGERWISVSGVEFFGGTVYAFRDLTESRRLEELKADFLSTASHELRTPLAAVYGAAQTLRRHDFALDESGRARFIELIVDESERLGRIVNEILLANQLELGLLDLATESFDAVELVKRVVEAARIHTPPGIDVDVAASETAPAVAADRDKVRQILTNLVENAIKYSPDGGRIEIGVEAVDSVVQFVVRDEGLGIPPDEQALIFDKFYRLDPDMTRGVGGTGLGLYICSELVERMGGRIWVESRDPAGSAFFFEIPADGTRPQRAASPAGPEATST